MVIKYPQKNEDIFAINPILASRDEFVKLGQIKMRFVSLVADKVNSPFRHKTGELLCNAVAKCIPDMWSGKLLKDEYIKVVELKDPKVNNAILLYDELFNPNVTKKILKRIENLDALSDAQDDFLNYKNNKAFNDDKKEKYQAECSKMIKDGILRKTTEEILYYQNLLSEHNALPIEVITRMDMEREQEKKDSSNHTETADEIDIDKITKE